MDMVIQANLIFSAHHALLGHRSTTGARMIELFAKVQQGVHRRHVTVWSVVRSPAQMSLSSGENARQIFVRNGDGGIRLVVFEQHIIARLVFLDEIVFQQQSILFRTYHHVTNIPYVAHE